MYLLYFVRIVLVGAMESKKKVFLVYLYMFRFVILLCSLPKNKPSFARKIVFDYAGKSTIDVI